MELNAASTTVPGDPASGAQFGTALGVSPLGTSSIASGPDVIGVGLPNANSNAGVVDTIPIRHALCRAKHPKVPRLDGAGSEIAPQPSAAGDYFGAAVAP
jgi:hypothetical protein